MAGQWAYVMVNYDTRSLRVGHDEAQAKAAARIPNTTVVAVPMQIGRIHLVRQEFVPELVIDTEKE